MVSSSNRVVKFMMIPSLLLIMVAVLPSSVDSTEKTSKSSGNDALTRQDLQKVSPQLLTQITLHGFLLWASMAFLTPVGILICRMSRTARCGKMLKIFFYTHVILQVVSVALATAGAVLALKYFENSFNNTHRRIGLSLYALIWMQPLIGFCRPKRGQRGRRMWYFAHWFAGTTLCILAIINVYIGLHVYHAKLLRNAKTWTMLFTFQVSVMAFIYLLQDRWDYIGKQGVILGQEQIIPSPINHRATSSLQMILKDSAPSTLS